MPAVQRIDPVHTDPVCGMKVSAEQAAGDVLHGNIRYFFCSQGCLRKFESDPTKYLSSAPRLENMDGPAGFVGIDPVAPTPFHQPRQKGVSYISPMGPEVRQSYAG